MQIIMPKLGLTMTHATITEWLKAPGDAVEAEEPLCSYETEKVTLELVAPQGGVLTEILVPAGTTIPAGSVVCELLLTEAALAQRARAAPAQPATATKLNATPKARALAREHRIGLAGLAGSGPEGRIQADDVLAAARPPANPAPPAVAPAPAEIKATPLARRIAAAEGVDLADLRGSGADGTIVREDVEQALQGREAEAGAAGRPGRPEVAPAAGTLAQAVPSAPSPAGTLILHSALRRTIAERMSQSAFSAPQVTLTTEAEATNLVSARAQLNLELPEADKLGYNALLAALTARALREHPDLNARWEDEGIRLLPEINVALAVDTERGLTTPVLHGVDGLSLVEVQRGYAQLAGRALAGRSLPEDFAGGTFTITNLGALEIDGFTPIINPPQAAILGVGRIVEKPVARDGVVVIRAMMTLSLSFDHRVVDGTPAARFLQRVKQLVERPMALMLNPAGAGDRTVRDGG